MKRSISFLSLIVLFFMSCEGPTGPEGPPGPQGQDGIDGFNIVGSVLEIETDFNPSNDYLVRFEFPPDEVEVLESDIVLVYLLWDVTEDSNGDPLPIWRLLPQNVFFDNGTVLQYNYDNTFLDVQIFLEGSVDLSTLGNEWTQDQIFRIVVVPADFVNNARIDIDYSDYYEVVRTFKLEDSHLKK
ncbi:hypothetical protein PZB74_20525 [Porifericola rhodea]|uniref:hypothetical protein n=1 Tax=Porifericola rhodea TaxID=930972 RepID=UPI002665325B|nr:hypothetical protein [Porifericola rhodea]WKN31340.1 hypothetical protein PZB74_20525 [Porifericola rhodea]